MFLIIFSDLNGELKKQSNELEKESILSDK